MIVKCTGIPIFWDDMLTIGKEYEVGEVEHGEYWIDDDNGEYNPVPSDCFEVVRLNK